MKYFIILFSLFFIAPANAFSIHDMVTSAARKAGVPIAAAHAMVRRESGYNPRVTGRAGEIGLAQIKLQTARAMGYRGSRAGLYVPSVNLYYGMRYLARALRCGGAHLYISGMGNCGHR